MRDCRADVQGRGARTQSKSTQGEKKSALKHSFFVFIAVLRENALHCILACEYIVIYQRPQKAIIAHSRALFMPSCYAGLSGIARQFYFMQSAVYPYNPIVFIGIAFCPVFLLV